MLVITEKRVRVRARVCIYIYISIDPNDGVEFKAKDSGLKASKHVE